MVSIDLAVCDECGTCISVCPADALMFNAKLRADRAKCISCGMCVKVCPFAAIQLDVEDRAVNAGKQEE
jgi:ferredoxin